MEEEHHLAAGWSPVPNSADTRKILKQIGVNFVISAPYSYDAAAVELYLAYYKQVQTNPDNEKTGKK